MRNAINTFTRTHLEDAVRRGTLNVMLDQCLIWTDSDPANTGYWRAPGHGVTQNRDEAFAWFLQTALDETQHTDPMHLLYEILVREGQPPTTAEAAIAAAAVRPQRSRIRDLITPGVLHQLQEFPENVTIRAMVLSQILKPIPDELKTYEAIVEWIETNVQPRRGDDVPFDEPRLQPTARIETLAEQLRNGRGITFTGERNATEHGRCTYVAPVYGTRNYTLSQQEIIDILNEAVDDGLDYDEVMGTISERMQEMMSENPPNTEIDWDEITHENHEETETHDHDDTFDTRTIRDQLWQYIRNHADRRIRNHFTENE